MNHTEQSQPWPQQDRHMDMQELQDLDFTNFLDIGDISEIGNLDVSDFASLDGPDAQAMGLDGPLQDFGTESFDLPIALDVQNFQGQAWGQQQAPQNVYRPPNIVPPTPNSYELQGNARHYMAQQMDSASGAFYEQHRHLTKDESMAFTPLVSPAVTPRDSTFHPIAEYTIPGAYFSPLTSPALHAQQQQTRAFAHSHYTHPTTADSSAAASPLDLNMDVESLKDMADIAPRKGRRKPQPPHSAGPAARLRQSPIVKAQRRRSTHLSTVIPPREVNNVLMEAQMQSQAQSALTPSTEYMANNEGSSAESISPEALTDSLMGPPPLPASAYHSPALQPQTHSAPASVAINSHQGPCAPCPATPASLMSIRKSQQQNGANRSTGPHPGSGQFQVQSQDHMGMLEDLALPPAAAVPARPAFSRVDTTPSGETTPRLAPAIKGTPRLAPSSSTTASPMIGAAQPPSMVSTPSFSGQKLDQKRSQPAKKRGNVSISSALVSPAIRPKISPSIKPLLPEGGLSESQQALLLASKSNYTHLLEGTRLPGVSYPESLSMGLTSKRTSHKLAEQGRRNRINEAIKEMQTLLPKAKGKGKAEEVYEEEEEAKDGKGNNTAEGRSANSKAATVESAIDYIKLLQQEKTIAFEMLKKKDEEMAALRKQLQAADISTSENDSASDSVVASNDEDTSAEPEKMEGVSASP